MNDRPVFRDEFDAGIWHQLQAALSAKDRTERLEKILAELKTCSAPVAGPLLSELIRAVVKEAFSDWPDRAEVLVALRRPQDAGPALTAAAAFCQKKMYKRAGPMVKLAEAGTNVPGICQAEAALQLAAGDRTKAAKTLRRALLSDPGDPATYALLKQAEPGLDWDCLLAAEQLAAGEEPVKVKESSSSEYTLYSIYREWYRGGRDEATSRLIASAGYREKDPFYCLASARMSADEGDWHSAQMMYDETCRAVPDDVRAACESGRARLAGGDPDGALVRYRRAEAFDPGSPTVLRGLAASYAAMSRKGEAAQVILELLDSELAGYEDYVSGAAALLEAGHVPEAEAAAEAVLQTYPGDARAGILHSQSELLKGNLLGALQIAGETVRANRKNADCLAQRSSVRLAMGRTRKALHDAKAAVAADPRNLTALTALMRARQEGGDAPGTIEACRQVLALDPDNGPAQDILSQAEFARQGLNAPYDDIAKTAGTSGAESFIKIVSSLLSEQRYSEAARLCKDNEERFGGLALVRRLRGNAEYGRGEYLKASAAYASAAVLEPENAVLWHSKGMADESFGDLESAEEAYGEAVLLDMKQPRYWVSRAVIQERKGNLRAAVESLDRAIELDPSSAYALVRKALILARLGRYSEALSFLDLADATEPGTDGIRQVRMDVCLAVGRYNESVALGRELLRRRPDNPPLVTRTARACLRLGSLQEARSLIEHALSVHQDDADLLAAARDLYTATGDSAAALPVCRKILTTAPDDLTTKKALAAALETTGHNAEAQEIYRSLGAEPEPAPSAATANASLQDPAALFGIAQSLMSAGDLTGAGRMADRAMAADPGNVEFMLFRARLYRETGDLRIAEAFLSQCLMRSSEEPALYEADGDLRLAANDLKGAAEQYGKATEHGRRDSRLYVKRGRVQEQLGAAAAAVNSYSTAVMLNPHDDEACRLLALAQLRVKNAEGAQRTMENSLSADPSAASYAVMARVCQARKDRDGVKTAYAAFLRYENATEADRELMAAALSGSGMRIEAGFIRDQHRPAAAEEVPAPIKRAAERLLRRAYLRKQPIDDPDLPDAVGLDSDGSAAVKAYLEDIPDYGEVMPGTNEFDRLEMLSLNVVTRGRAAMELPGELPLECAYVAGGAKDADEAKLLVAYVRSALAGRLPKEIPAELMQAAAKYTKTDELTAIMKKENVGVYRARLIRSKVQ
ncbi:MAG: tetratricopeptide repeat protein [Methanomethylophilus sp.]